MTYPLWKAYCAFDDKLMRGVNLGVRAWNWTTGRTKTDLTNGMLTVAPMLECSGMILSNPIVSIIYIPCMITLSHCCQKINKEIDALEQKTAESSTMHFESEIYKKYNELYGPGWSSIGLVNDSLSIAGRSLDYSLTGTGYFIRGASHYIMRAEHLPPRKNCLRRGMDKLESLIAEYRSRPGGVPVPVPAG